jgi:hypothetical protein
MQIRKWQTKFCELMKVDWEVILKVFHAFGNIL